MNLRLILRGLFWVFLITSFVLYLIYYNQIKEGVQLIRNLAIPVIFIFGIILVVDKYKERIHRKKMKDEMQEVLYVTSYDAMKNDLLAFFIAAAILLTASLFSEGGIDTIDIIQAIIAFIAIYYVRIYYFGKSG